MTGIDDRHRFYHTQRWVRCRAAYLASRHFVCERCGAPASVVHHRQYVTDENVDDPSIVLSFDNLEALCVTCHAIEHHGKGATAEGLAFTSDGQLVEVH